MSSNNSFIASLLSDVLVFGELASAASLTFNKAIFALLLLFLNTFCSSLRGITSVLLLYSIESAANFKICVNISILIVLSL